MKNVQQHFTKGKPEFSTPEAHNICIWISGNVKGGLSHGSK